MLINNVNPESFFAAPDFSNPDDKHFFHFKDLSLTERALLIAFIRAINKKTVAELEEILNNL